MQQRIYITEHLWSFLKADKNVSIGILLSRTFMAKHCQMHQSLMRRWL